MVSSFDKAMGILERTSAEVAEGPFAPGRPSQRGYLFVAEFEGVNSAAFEVAPGQILFTLEPGNFVSARKVASGLNIVIDVQLRAGDGDIVTLTLIGPRGRMKRIFELIGHPL